MLRATIVPLGVDAKRDEVSKKLLAKDGWYIAADFSTDPPQVILTEKPAEGSRWALEAADSPGHYFFKNEDALGKAVWLTMENEAKLYRDGVARKPILSAEKHRFSIEDAESGK
jgi:hypothetical protein